MRQLRTGSCGFRRKLLLQVDLLLHLLILQPQLAQGSPRSSEPRCPRGDPAGVEAQLCAKPRF